MAVVAEADIAEVAEILAKSAMRDEAFDALGEAVRRLTGADGMTVVLREGNFCHYIDENAVGPLWKNKRFPIEKCISGWAMVHRVPVAIADIYADPRIPWDAYKPTFVKSLAMAPIGSGDPIGALGAYWAVKRHPTESEVATLRALAGLAEGVIEKRYAASGAG